MSGPIGGLEQQAWGKAQGTFDTFESIAATDAFDFVEMTIEPELAREEIQSHIGTLSAQGFIEGKRGGKWSLSSYIRPTTAGTAPDLGFLLTHALGTETDGASDVTYTLNDDAPSGLQFYRYASDDFLECIGGAWIEELEFTIEGGSPPMMKVSGGFASYGCLMQGVTIGATEATGQTVLTLTSGHARRVRPGIFVQFPDDDNSGAGYRVTDVDVANETMTVTPGLAGGGLESGDAVTPLVPSQTLAGTPVAGLACGLSLGGTSIGLIKATVKLATGVKGLDKEASANRANRLHRTKRSVSGELQCYYLDESAPFAQRTWDIDTGYLAAIIRAGADTAGRRVKLNLDRITLDPAKWAHSDEDASDFTLSFRGHQASAAGDEFEVVFD